MALALILEAIAFSIAPTLVTAVLQMLAGVYRLGALMGFVSRSVVTGFVNAVAILIFLAQLPEITGENVRLLVLGVVGVGLLIISGLPRLTKAVPSPLICIVVLTAPSIVLGFEVRTVGDMGELPSTLPVFL